MFKLFKNKENNEQEAIDKVLNSLYALEDAMYNEEMAQIDREKAATIKELYLISLDECKEKPNKEKAFKDVIMACVLLEEYPSPQNSRLLDDKLEIAKMFD